MAQSGMDVEGAERVDAEDEVAWARTALKGLGSVEVTMRCPICQGFFRSPCSLKGCGHAFCSECIRRAVQVKSECPTCRKKSSAVDLIPNKAADAMVRAFLRERPEFAAVARGLPVSGESDAVATSAHGQVSTGRAGNSAGSKRSKEVEKKRLPNVNFHLLKDKRVREMASGYKLSSTGPRIKVVRRIKEYILLVNTLVDGDAPMTEADLERVRQNVIAKEALLDRDTGPSLLGGSGKKGSLPPVVLNDAMMQLFARLRQDVITREGIKRPGGKRGNKRKAKRLKREAKTDDTGSRGLEGEKAAQTKAANALLPAPTASPMASISTSNASAQTPKNVSCSSSKRVSAKQAGLWRRVQTEEIPGFVVNYNTETREVYLEPLSSTRKSPRLAASTKQEGQRQQVGDVLKSGATQVLTTTTTVDLLDSNRSKDSFVEVVEEVRRPATWECRSCTFMNTDGKKLTCEICGNARPSAAASSSKLPIDLLRKSSQSSNTQGLLRTGR